MQETNTGRDGNGAAIRQTGHGPEHGAHLHSKGRGAPRMWAPGSRERDWHPRYDLPSVPEPDADQGHPGNLPTEVSSFVGRRTELTEVATLLSRTRLLTLTGAGGVGKTRLALRVAASVQDDFSDGVWLLELGDLGVAESVEEQLAALFGIEHDPRRGLGPGLRRFLADRSVLLVLDNCEHLLDQSAKLAGALLRHGEGVRVLCTSRQPLGILGEHIHEVAPLGVPAPGRPARAAESGRFDAVSLFAARAAAIRPGFEVTDANYETVTRLCRRLDGIPLAIELAAARLGALSAGQILDRLDDRFRLLTKGNRLALPRQRTLRALIDWSFALCSEAERTVWARLSVFSGGFDLAAAAAVCGEGFPADDVDDLVTGLVEKSVVVRADTDDGQVRYRLLETIRHYGQDRLAESGDRAGVLRRHRDWFRALARRAGSEWMSSDQSRISALFQLEGGNLRAALEFSLADDDGGQAALEMVIALCDHRRAWATLGEARRWLDRALVNAPGRTVVRARALAAAGWAALVQGDRTTAGRLLRECRTLAEELGDAPSRALAVQYSGLARVFAGHFAHGAKLLAEAVDRHRELGDTAAEQLAFAQLTMARCFGGDPAGARAVASGAVQPEPRRSPTSHAWWLWCHGLDRWKHRDHEVAARSLRSALGVRAARGDKVLTAMALETYAWTWAERGDPVAAAVAFGAAEAARRATGCALSGLRHVHVPHLRYAAVVRADLGEETYQRHYATGLRSTVDEVLAGPPPEVAVPSPRERPPAANPLTPRELEVALLIAKGLSNKEIAATLVIALRTAESHVEHILSKLEFGRRAQIAVWASTVLPAREVPPS
ncbi:LuxR C-terminal-related transcriptional regulator [Amycolatopsis sp., V23-08]|uniref:LuxR C-terminal-related transcriptional regulator n=1 Tax=Amycolatopsis heterodermiae TaxID=3110235 RepID=A0ABU5RH98_9PSEU|nr:LuxR C-terminal-related transcriptional regulator [Amycolatopsis sp., V23-08]MEA5365225.1 LuxR C-terminal-related transcriptional regulator [Amycolatopsis sp., V23-08]